MISIIFYCHQGALVPHALPRSDKTVENPDTLMESVFLQCVPGLCTLLDCTHAVLIEDALISGVSMGPGAQMILVASVGFSWTGGLKRSWADAR